MTGCVGYAGGQNIKKEGGCFFAYLSLTRRIELRVRAGQGILLSSMISVQQVVVYRAHTALDRGKHQVHADAVSGNI